MGNPDNSALLQENSDTLIVVPVFAESSVIADVVTELAQYFPNICCIDDGSPDSSGVIALQAGAQVIWHPMNLGQGELQQSSGKQTSVFWYQASAVLFGIWLVTLITTHAIHLYSLTSKNKVLDQQIAVIYREFFPQAQQVISPKFRITQLLKSNVATEQDSLWQLLDKLSQALVRSQITIEQLRFQNAMLAVTLTSKDFAALEKLQVALRQAKVNVEQTQASSHEQQVVATLELSLWKHIGKI